MKIIQVILITTSVFLGCSQNVITNNPNTVQAIACNPNEILTLNEYHQDFTELVKTLVSTHPQPYTFISKDSFEYLTKLQYDKITDSRIFQISNTEHTYRSSLSHIYFCFRGVP